MYNLLFLGGYFMKQTVDNEESALTDKDFNFPPREFMADELEEWSIEEVDTRILKGEIAITATDHDDEETLLLFLKTLDNISVRLDKMDYKIENTIKLVSNMCVATIIGIMAIVISVASIAFAVVMKLSN